MAFLIDTDIWIYYFKDSDLSSRIATHFKKRLREGLFMATPTYGELLYGAYRSKETDSQVSKINALFLFAQWSHLTQKTFAIWGKLKAELSLSGEPLADVDLMIASCALEKHLTLVTNNWKHFQRIKSLRLANWVNEEP